MVGMIRSGRASLDAVFEAHQKALHTFCISAKVARAVVKQPDTRVSSSVYCAVRLLGACATPRGSLFLVYTRWMTPNAASSCPSTTSHLGDSGRNHMAPMQQGSLGFVVPCKGLAHAQRAGLPSIVIRFCQQADGELTSQQHLL